MRQIVILPRQRRLIDHDVTKTVQQLRDSGIQCHQLKTLSRIEENGVIVIHSGSDYERAVTILNGMDLRVQ